MKSKNKIKNPVYKTFKENSIASNLASIILIQDLIRDIVRDELYKILNLSDGGFLLIPANNL